MTLRIELSIIPFGIEEEKRIIEVLNISNVSFDEGITETGENTYVIEHNNYKNYGELTPRVFHKRSDSALTLLRKSLEVLGY